VAIRGLPAARLLVHRPDGVESSPESVVYPAGSRGAACAEAQGRPLRRCIAKLALRCAKLQLQLLRLGEARSDAGTQLLHLLCDTHAELLMPYLTPTDSAKLMALFEQIEEEVGPAQQQQQQQR
jgi:hypothetical protein